MNALQECHCLRMPLLEPAARGGSFQRKAHLDVGRRELAAGKPLALRKLALPVIHVLLELRIDQRRQRLVADLAHQGPQQRRRPPRLRGSGQGFCYNFGRGIGALFPLLVGALSATTSLANAIAIFAVVAYAVFFIAAFALPETRGRALHAN